MHHRYPWHLDTDSGLTHTADASSSLSIPRASNHPVQSIPTSVSSVSALRFCARGRLRSRKQDFEPECGECGALHNVQGLVPSLTKRQ
ncbi:hypothetical protein MRB53_037075 [Persea americana]|nr:hypothetical protein MRB53_037075 [Persea americana]